MYCLRGRTKIGVQLCFVHAKVTKLSHSDNDMAEKLGQLLIDRPTKMFYLMLKHGNVTHRMDIATT